MALLHFSICTTSKYLSASVSSPLPSAERRNLIISYSSRKEWVSKEEKPLRSTKSIEGLCNDIRDFMSMVGLPEDSVPTMKELAQHGRQDLANRVRRRGYTLIAEHLLKPDKCDSFMEGHSQSVTNTMEVDTNVEGISSMNCDPSNSCQDNVIGTMDVPEIHVVDPGVARTNDCQIGNYPEKFDEVVGSGQINGNSKFSGDDLGSNFMTTSEQESWMNHIEIDRLKEMLRQKELELSQLKQQIGSEKGLRVCSDILFTYGVNIVVIPFGDYQQG